MLSDSNLDCGLSHGLRDGPRRSKTLGIT
jgi:hypothetical protein